MKQTFNDALHLVKFTQKQFSSHISFTISDQSTQTEVRAFLLPTSTKPEITIFIYDVYYDVFFDTKHKITHERCFARAHVKDLIKACISEYYSV